jgi:signal transduction histidine kinase/ActR/RegA family two-component response regulator
MEVLEIRGNAAQFLTLPVGKVSFHLLKLIPDTGLFLEIEKLIHEAAGSGEAARRLRVPCESGGSICEVNIEVTPVYGNESRALLVILEPAQSAEKHIAESLEKPLAQEEAIASRDRQIHKLKKEVEEARRRLQSFVEDYQTSEEESQSATEEALSTNEELQSLNEELETAKEELQSTNEELITVNQELESKNTALTESHSFMNAIVETVPVPLLVLDNEQRIKTVNQSFSKTFLILPREAEGRLLYSLGGSSWDIPGLRDLMDRVLSGGESFDSFEVEREFPSIGTRDLNINGRRLDHLDLILVAVNDVTVRKQAERSLHKSEEALRQAQKMEAIGRLAGGVAHDFNNLLTTMIGYCQLASNTLTEGHKVTEYVHQIESAAQKAAALADQLLSFSRRKVLQPKVFDVNAVVDDLARMLRRSVGEQVKVVVRLASDLWLVRADPSEIGRALMNLCLNARDAMPAGGTLTIRTANVTFGDAAARMHNLGTGRYVELLVRDTGIGMGPETQIHVFEPFFTTKGTGKGTGMGLAIVLGIAEQSGGTVWCESKVGKGTRFKLLLPATTAASEPEVRPAGGMAEAPKGSEVVLLVEDEDQVRKLASEFLQGQGYVVLEARDGREGLSVCKAHQGKIDLLLSDVVMPELGGRELAERILTMRPDIKLLFMSGHTQDVILKEGIEAGTPFLQKPFAPSDLANKVRAVLDSHNGGSLSLTPAPRGGRSL